MYFDDGAGGVIYDKPILVQDMPPLKKGKKFDSAVLDFENGDIRFDTDSHHIHETFVFDTTFNFKPDYIDWWERHELYRKSTQSERDAYLKERPWILKEEKASPYARKNLKGKQESESEEESDDEDESDSEDDVGDSDVVHQSDESDEEDG